MGSLSTATNTTTDPSSSARRRAARTQAGGGPSYTHGHFPHGRGAPRRRLTRLDRGPLRTPSGARGRPGRVRDRTIVDANRCGESWSRHAARRRTSSEWSGAVGATATLAMVGTPRVIVPVLSKSSTRPCANRSSAPPSFTITPRCAQRDIPDTIAIGAASSSGQGVATTSTATARTASPDTAHAKGSDHGERHEPQCVSICEPHERRLVSPGSLDQAHHTRIGALSAVVVTRKSMGPPRSRPRCAPRRHRSDDR